MSVPENNDSAVVSGCEPAVPARRLSLGALNGSIALPNAQHWLRRLIAFTGPGYMVAVGYMDPGNWATDIAGGSQFGYLLLSVILLSSLIAILLQALAARLGIVTGLDLAQACREQYSRPTCIALWLACESAIIACDVAEVIGTAIALNLLFGLPLSWGVILSVADVFLILMLMGRGFRALEAFVITLLTLIFICFGVQMVLVHPSIGEIVAGSIPHSQIVADPIALYLAIGIIGATVMPHNLYLHSSIVQTRAYPRTSDGRKFGLHWAVVDSSVALMLALFVNAAILITAAEVFNKAGRTDVLDIEQAYHLLSPMLGVGVASTLFAVALLASGINSTVTATLAGQIVMEGFLQLRVPDWMRRLLTRGLAVIPVIAVTSLYGPNGATKLLVFSQVALSMQLPFAVIPLVRFVSSRKLMGDFVTGRWLTFVAWGVALLIVVLNVELLVITCVG
ncbi:Nramp family divalent metal transporter [Pseudomonas sp. 10B1]|uniref:Nramp family divalent metal transporter n=1 Tax=unclassified Pseudomonas TaxID=196821 RepID=UPI002AB33FDE|nr:MULTISPECIES: Nramp family divalent metal transporter [unclassified Pseudomonas]MDY7560858.1 Nramp family divalent metal transporter [Pseudomonas sp. AB6]MEA9976474.1 Nramp family divalent metal transporter [Pseudomonas sp. RTS4]MEA9996191.1 Nramp family divalent metal transporter [Pseudomonas sp. AA4]MEB0088923.1 Nramp family divalent metal transporter [Pseudomonas sp. RTI1]MEB0128033.1 Nramp family divalent metal transporter [Pseudomonas sp. CCC1.2]